MRSVLSLEPRKRREGLKERRKREEERRERRGEEVKVRPCSEAGSEEKGVCFVLGLTASRTGVISRCFPHRNWRSEAQVLLSE